MNHSYKPYREMPSFEIVPRPLDYGSVFICVDLLPDEWIDGACRVFRLRIDKILDKYEYVYFSDRMAEAIRSDVFEMFYREVLSGNLYLNFRGKWETKEK